MNLCTIFHLIAYMLLVLGLAMLVCWGISIYYNDPARVQTGLAMAGTVVLAAGLIGALLTRGPADLSRRDGFGIVTLGWISASLFGALPSTRPRWFAITPALSRTPREFKPSPGQTSRRGDTPRQNQNAKPCTAFNTSVRDVARSTQ